MPKSYRLVLGIALGSLLTAIGSAFLLSEYLHSSLRSGIVDILVAISILSVGPLVASIIGGRREALAGLVTGIIGYLGGLVVLFTTAIFVLSATAISLTRIFDLISIPTFIIIIIPGLILFSIIGAVFGAVVGQLRKITKPSKSTEKRLE